MHLGVDAGNTKTVALVCRSDGTVLGFGRRGTGDIYGAKGAADAVRAVFGAVESALQAAHVHTEAVTSAAFRLAGVDWPEDEAYWSVEVERLLPDICRRSIRNDGFAPLRCSRPDGTGVAVVVGTGPAVAARGPHGAEWALGWWALESLGGSGLGDAACAAVYRQALGLGPPTALSPALLAVYGCDSPEQLLHSFTRREGARPWQDRALAARAVLAEAQLGDEVAGAIVRAQARALAGYARVAAVRVGFHPTHDAVPVVLAGSVLAAESSPLAPGLVEALAEVLPRGLVSQPGLPPVAGAALDAIAEDGRLVDARTVEALTRTLPGRELLET